MEQSFDQFNAALLYCNQCRKAMPVRERLLLVLPEGSFMINICKGCNSSVGSKPERVGLKPSVAKPRLGG